MSQNGPPWSRGDSDEPYTEPADPWADQGAVQPDTAWGTPASPVAYQPAPPPSGGSVWAPPAPPPKRNTPMLALVFTLCLIIVVGLAATVWLLADRNDKPTGQADPSASAEPGPAPLGSEDARFFAKKGDCVTNEGSDTKPKMRTSACASGTYKVLARIDGPTTGEEDAEGKCAKVPGYTKWYFFDSQLDELDFVLCLKEHKAL